MLRIKLPSMAFRFLFKLVLAFAFIYHGIWNLTGAGEAFWNSGAVLFPEWMRYPVGWGEIILAIGLLVPFAERLSALLLAALMIGAILSNFSNGYSYKDLGIEVPVAYTVMLLALAMGRIR
jgi:uncharacterized membrane protein YphA (DoxX/SURF4 family)